MSARVTVLLCVYNGERYLAEAIDSVRAQTFSDYELLVIDDGSTDGTPALLEAICRDEPRLRVVRQDNAGLTVSLNRGLALARGDVIARQDADDVSLPHRLAGQVAWLEAHPETLVVGCRYGRTDAQGRVFGAGAVPVTDLGIRLALLDHNAIPHSGATFRRRPVLDAGGYDETLRTAQDYDLWCRLALTGGLRNLRRVALHRREHGGRVGATQQADQLANRDAIAARYRAAILDGQGPRGLAGRMLRAAAWWKRRRAR